MTEILLLQCETKELMKCIFWTHYSMVKPQGSNLRIITAVFETVRFFRISTVILCALMCLQGRNAFFQELHSHPYIPNQNTDMTIAIVQKQVWLICWILITFTPHFDLSGP